MDTKILLSALFTKGYSKSLLRRSLKAFQQTNPICVSSMLPFITTTYSSLTVRLQAVFWDCYSIIELLQHQNLQELLVKAKLEPLIDPKMSSYGDLFFFSTADCCTTDTMIMIIVYLIGAYKVHYGSKRQRAKQCGYPNWTQFI